MRWESGGWGLPHREMNRGELSANMWQLDGEWEDRPDFSFEGASQKNKYNEAQKDNHRKYILFSCTVSSSVNLEINLQLEFADK